MTDDDKLSKLQLLEQNAQQFLAQRQQFQSQLIEVQSALSALENSGEQYRIVGNIMVRADQAALKEELSGKKEMLELRIKSVEKQEQKLKEKAKQIQGQIMEGMGDAAKE